MSENLVRFAVHLTEDTFRWREANVIWNWQWSLSGVSVINQTWGSNYHSKICIPSHSWNVVLICPYTSSSTHSNHILPHYHHRVPTYYYIRSVYGHFEHFCRLKKGSFTPFLQSVRALVCCCIICLFNGHSSSLPSNLHMIMISTLIYARQTAQNVFCSKRRNAKTAPARVWRVCVCVAHMKTPIIMGAW